MQGPAEGLILGQRSAPAIGHRGPLGWGQCALRPLCRRVGALPAWHPGGQRARVNCLAARAWRARWAGRAGWAGWWRTGRGSAGCGKQAGEAGWRGEQGKARQEEGPLRLRRVQALQLAQVRLQIARQRLLFGGVLRLWCVVASEGPARRWAARNGHKGGALCEECPCKTRETGTRAHGRGAGRRAACERQRVVCMGPESAPDS